MELNFIPSILSGILCASLAFLVLVRNFGSLVHQAFALGMFSLGLRDFGSVMFLIGIPGFPSLQWIKVSLVGEAMLPGSWLLFSLSFARSNYKELLPRWRWATYACFFIPFFLIVPGWPKLLLMPADSDGIAEKMIPLGPSGYFLKLFLLISLIIAVANLEGTYRSADGVKRRQIKSMILGSGGILAFGIFDAVQTLLYSSINLNNLIYRPFPLILADLVILFALIRHQLLNVDVFVSRYVVYQSVTLFFSGIYLFLVGLIVLGVQRLGGGHIAPLVPVLIFALLLILVSLLLSEQVRWKAKLFIDTHFYRNKHDYRVKWQEFTQSVGSKLTMGELAPSVVSWVSDTLGTNAAALWIDDAKKGKFQLTGQVGPPCSISSWSENCKLIQFLSAQSLPVVKESLNNNKDWSEVVQENPGFFGTDSVSVFVPLFSGSKMLGFAALGPRVTRDPYDFHDLEFLKTLGDQIAGQIHRVKLTEDLSRAKELEAFQTLSAFFIHDLKNLSSTLSLVVQNVPTHYENPEFRKDAFRVISESVGKMNGLCGNLSLMTKKIEINPIEVDLNVWVTSTLHELECSSGIAIVKDLNPLSKCFLDPDQFQKVLINLVLNASEAMNNQGKILVSTSQKNGWIKLAVGDSGCGMCREFIENSLFKPFITTKSKGLGVGLFHCKNIVEAHQGLIEVESEVGKGSIFNVMLPLKPSAVDWRRG